jgi:hypothetical protein
MLEVGTDIVFRFLQKEKYCVMELLPGSDAIAGNIFLKNKLTEVSKPTGVTSQGDGFNFGADLNSLKSLTKVL